MHFCVIRGMRLLLLLTILGGHTSQAAGKMWFPRCTLSLDWQKDPAVCAAFNADSSSVLVGTVQANLAWLNTATGEEIWRQPAHKFRVYQVAIAAGADLAVSCGAEKLADGRLTGFTLAVWNLGKGTLVKRFQGAQYEPSSMAVSADGKFIALATNCVTVFSVETGEVLYSTKAARYGVATVAFSPCGRLLAFGTRGSSDRVNGTNIINIIDRDVHIIELETGTPRYVLRGHREDLINLQFTHAGKRLMSASAKSVIIWDTDTGRQEEFIKMDDLVCRNATATDSQIQIVDWSQTLRVWDRNNHEYTDVFGFPFPRSVRMILSADARFVLTASADRLFQLWCLSPGLPFGRHAAPEAIRSLIFSPTGNQLVSACGTLTVSNGKVTADGKSPVTIINLATAQEQPRNIDRAGPLLALAVGRTHGQVFSGGWDGIIQHWDSLEEGAAVIGDHGAPVREIAVLSAGQFVVSSGGPFRASYSSSGVNEANLLKVWDLKAAGSVRTLGDPAHPVVSLLAAPDTPVFLAGSEGGMLALWDARTGEQIRQFRGHKTAVVGLAWLPKQGQFLSVGKGGTVFFWELDSAKPVSSFTIGPRGTNVNDMALSPDGEHLLIGHRDGYVELWGLSECKRKSKWDWSAAAIVKVAFSPDGRLAACGDVAGRITWWGLDL